MFRHTLEVTDGMQIWRLFLNATSGGLLPALLVFATFTAACDGGADESSTPTGTLATATVAATEPRSATASPVADQTPSPSLAPAPSPTATASPTAAQAPSPSPTPAPSPTVSTTPAATATQTPSPNPTLAPTGTSERAGTPVLDWVTPRGSYTQSTRSYRGGVPYTRNLFNYFTVTGGSGSLEIAADLQDAGEATVTVLVEQGASYKLTVHLLYSLKIRGRSQILTLSAPSSPSKRVTIVGDAPQQDFWFFALGDLAVEPWTPEPPRWSLIATVMGGAGTVSADIGTLWGSAENYYSADPYEDGAEVTLTVQPAHGYIFDRWEVVQSGREYSITEEPPSIVLRMTGNTQVKVFFADECLPRDTEPRYRVMLHNDDVHTLSYVVEALVTTIPQQLDEERATEILLPLVGTASGKVVVAICGLEVAERYRDALGSLGLIVSIEPDP